MADTVTPPAVAPAARATRPPRRSWRLPAMLAPLGHRDYSLLFAGQLISSIGNTFYSVALPWYMLTQGGGAINLGLVLTAYGAPLGLTTLLGGWLSDTMRARRVMLVADAACAVVTAGLAWATFTHAPLWALASLTAALGAFEGLFAPASQAIAPDLLPDDQLQAANGLFYALMRLAQMAGPALAGLVVARTTAGNGFTIDAATFAVSVATLFFIHNRVTYPPQVATTASVEGATGASDAEAAPAEASAEPASSPPVTSLWRYTLSSPFFQVLLLVILVGNLFNGAVMEVAIPALAQGPLRAGAQGYGFILTGWGGGALLGALLASALGNRINRGYYSIMFFSLQVFAVAGLAYAADTLMATGCMAAFGALNSLGNVSFLTLVQRRLPRAMLGRIMGVFLFCNFATLPLSVAVGGFATARYGAPAVILGGAAIMLGAMVIAFANREIRTM